MKKSILRFSASILLAALLAAPCPALADENELVAHWSMDGIVDGTVADLSGNGNALTLQDPTYELVKGYTENTLDFTGTTTAYDDSKGLTMDAGKIGSQLSGASGITITAYLKKEVLNSGTNFTFLRYYIDNVGVCMSLSAGAKAITVQARSASQTSTMLGLTSEEIIYPTRTTYEAVSGWMQIACVYDYAGKTIRLYADGIQIGEATDVAFATEQAEFSAASTGYFGIGSRTVLVDDVKIYKRAMTAQEISESVPPVLEYDFEEVTEGKIADQSAHGMDITVAGDYTEKNGVEGNTVAFTTATLPVDTISGVLYGAKTVSASVWVKLPEGALPAAQQSLILESQGGFNLRLEPSGQISYTARTVSGAGYGTVMTNEAVFKAGDTSWHHVYVTLDYRDFSAKIYVDGALAGFKTLEPSGNQFKIHYFGMSASSKNDTLDLCSSVPVLLDSLKFYRRGLSESELAVFANALPIAEAEFSTGETSVTADCVIANQSGQNLEKSVLILAMYDKQTPSKLRKATFVELPSLETGGRTQQAVTLEAIDDPAGYRYKLFVWTDFTNMVSLQNAIEYEPVE